LKGFTELNVKYLLELTFPNDIDQAGETGAARQFFDDFIHQDIIDSSHVIWRKLTRMQHTYGPVGVFFAN